MAMSEELAIEVEIHGSTPRLYDTLCVTGRHSLAVELGRLYPATIPRGFLNKLADKIEETSWES